MRGCPQSLSESAQRLAKAFDGVVLPEEVFEPVTVDSERAKEIAEKVVKNAKIRKRNK